MDIGGVNSGGVVMRLQMEDRMEADGMTVGSTNDNRESSGDMFGLKNAMAKLCWSGSSAQDEFIDLSARGYIDWVINSAKHNNNNNGCNVEHTDTKSLLGREQD